MRYESAKTEKGNVGVSYDSQEAADLQAAAMDKNGCSDCSDCSGCSGCSDCSRCTDCSGCSGCSDCSRCTDCSDCSDCRYCHGCLYCSGCHGCSLCSGCSGCYNCFGCTDCSDCSDCRYCHGCLYCSGCHGCSGCTDTQGTLRWKGGPAKALLSLNGLRWPVSTDGKSIQIGCQHHSVDGWRAFDDRVIARMDLGALDFWKKYKLVVLGLAEVRKSMGGSDE